MVEWVVDNVRPLDPLGTTLVVTQDLVGKTKGAVDTICKVAHLVVPDAPLVVANCDQLIAIPYHIDLDGLMSYRGYDGVVFTFQSANTAHSYVTTKGLYEIDSIVEKPETPPSDKAVSGVYWFKEARDFIESCRVVNFSEEGEQYVSSALDDMIQRGVRLAAVPCSTAILGTPEDFQRFETAMAVMPPTRTGHICHGDCTCER